MTNTLTGIKILKITQSKNGAKGKKGNKPSYSKEELSKIRDQIKENMISAAQAAGAGNVPKEVERMIKELTELKMTWRELLRTQIQSTIKNDFTFQRPSRKAWHTGVIMPGMKNDETIDICIALDMSGSIGDSQAKDFLSEIQGIMQEYKDYNIKVWCFDTKVYNEQDFSADNGMELEDYQIMGGGGTDFMANWDYMKEQGIVPNVSLCSLMVCHGIVGVMKTTVIQYLLFIHITIKIQLHHLV